MRDQDGRAITDAVLASFTGSRDPRLAEAMRDIVRHLHDAVRAIRPTEQELMAGIGFLAALGRRGSAAGEELIELSDVLGVSALLDELRHAKLAGGTESTILGPFYKDGVEVLPNGARICEGLSGAATVVAGRVLDPDGAPQAGALVDVWQGDGEGHYDVEHGDAATATRGRFRTGADGRFWFRTVKPVSYPIPADGPLGRLLDGLGRRVERPAHIHFRLEASGLAPLTTHLFVAGDEHLDDDPVFGVKRSLIVPFPEVDDPRLARRWGVDNPFHLVRHDFVLESRASSSRRDG
jgi:protocatechuate 3,4-dioxygenase beta subunit